MMHRPSEIWKSMPVDKRVLAAEAFWRDTDSPDIQMQQAEVTIALARRLNFRAKSVQALAIERRAKHLGHMADVSDAVATRALIAYHFSNQRPLMAAFLEALGIPHEDGVITEETVAPPDRARLATAVTAIKSSFDTADVDLYLRTLTTLDGDTWGALDGLLSESA
jgi:hypothetical protein